MILAIDTATRAVSMALFDGHRIRAEQSWQSVDHHTVEVAPALQQMLARCDVSPADLRAVAVPLGPGSYTGLRIGMSVAKGLILSAPQRPALIAVPTLDIVAQAQPNLTGCLCTLAQAGRGRFNACMYRWDGGWLPDGSPFITRAADLVAHLSAPTQIAGELADPDFELLAGCAFALVAPPSRSMRRAAVLAELAGYRLAAGQVDDPQTIAPIYLS
jgi:tRNA threonylcarbamoyladenosine biosynthesis protein TsaB